jgi:hypothetical protein
VRAPLAPETAARGLNHVRWIGGAPGAGKSTVATRLAIDHGLRLYSSDDAIADHVRRSNPQEHPLLHRFLQMDMDERWVRRSPAEMLRTFPWFQGEGFEFIEEDLLALPVEPPILVEGFRLLPRLVAPLLSSRHQAIWLVPTGRFQRAAFDARGFTWEIPNRTNDPARALSNLRRRDELFAREVVSEGQELQVELTQVDLDASVEDLITRVASALGLGAS